MPLYGTSKYWETHYTNDDDETYDWLLTFPKLRSILVEHAGTSSLSKRSRLQVLIVGCGKSTMPEQMYDAGWKTMHAIDISKTVIQHMKKRQINRKNGKRGRKGLTFQLQDALKLSKNNQFHEKYDFIFEKSTFDALLCTRNESTLTIKLYLENIYHSLKFGGTFMIISLGPPKRRLSKLKQPGLDWQIIVNEIPKPNMDGFNVRDDDERYIFVYILTKKLQTDFKVASTKIIEEVEEPPLDPDAIDVFEWPGEIEARRKKYLTHLKTKFLPVEAYKTINEAKQKRKEVLKQLKLKLLPCS